MKYNVYFKRLGIKRRDFNAIMRGGLKGWRQKKSFGTNNHEIWLLDFVLACELYPRLKYWQEHCDFTIHFSDYGRDDCADTHEKEHDENFQKIISSLEYLIISGITGEDFIDKYMQTDPETGYRTLDPAFKEEQQRLQEGFDLLGKYFWGMGI